MRRSCPGSGAIANPCQEVDWCPMCGRIYAIRYDGTLRRHRMDYALIVEHMAHIVREDELQNGRRW